MVSLETLVGHQVPSFFTVMFDPCMELHLATIVSSKSYVRGRCYWNNPSPGSFCSTFADFISPVAFGSGCSSNLSRNASPHKYLVARFPRIRAGPASR